MKVFLKKTPYYLMSILLSLFIVTAISSHKLEQGTHKSQVVKIAPPQQTTMNTPSNYNQVANTEPVADEPQTPVSVQEVTSPSEVVETPQQSQSIPSAQVNSTPPVVRVTEMVFNAQ